MIRDARLIAVEGAHGTGKTTLVHALASRLKELHLHVGVQRDAARESPLVEDAIIHRHGEIDIATELHLFGSQLAGEQALARHHDLVLCDKSLLSVNAYSRLLLDGGLNGSDTELLAAMSSMSHVYARRYDAIFLLEDLYDLRATADRLRLAEEAQRERAAALLDEECRTAGVKVHTVPRGLPTEQKVAWVISRVPESDAG